jgi:hypothetical protein
MDTNAFYGLFSATCFALVGLWWNAVALRPKVIKNPAMKRDASGVYFSFLIPGMMGLGAQVTGADDQLWRWVFVAGAVIGALTWAFLIRSTPKKEENPGFFRRNRWIVVALYLLILGGSLGMDKLVQGSSVTPLQVEAFMMCLLVLMGHGISWETLMSVPPGED